MSAVTSRPVPPTRSGCAVMAARTDPGGVPAGAGHRGEAAGERGERHGVRRSTAAVDPDMADRLAGQRRDDARDRLLQRVLVGLGRPAVDHAGGEHARASPSSSAGSVPCPHRRGAPRPRCSYRGSDGVLRSAEASSPAPASRRRTLHVHGLAVVAGADEGEQVRGHVEPQSTMAAACSGLFAERPYTGESTSPRPAPRNRPRPAPRRPTVAALGHP